MATFTIHQDEENLQQPFQKGKKTALDGGKKRVPLVTLCSNNENKNSLALKPKKDLKKVIPSDKFSLLENRVGNLSVKDEEESGSSVLCAKVSAEPLIKDTFVQDDKENKQGKIAKPLSLDVLRAQLDEWFSFSEYIDDIYVYLRQAEKLHKPKPYYMKLQTDITYSMRAILVDWLVEVGEEYKLHTDTFFLAVSYIDRFLSCMSVSRSKLQLLGTASLFVAAKFEEIYPPQASDFAYVTDNFYTMGQVLTMERLILQALKHNMSRPTTHTFITLLSAYEKIDSEVTQLALYIAELSLLEGDPYLEFNPSIIACGCIALARHCLGEDSWPKSYIKSTRYCLADLTPILMHLNATHAKSFTRELAAIRNKYSQSNYKSVSEVPSRALRPSYKDLINEHS